MRIAYVTETWPPEVNGVALTAARAVDFLRRHGHRVDVIRPRQAGEAAGDGVGPSSSSSGLAQQADPEAGATVLVAGMAIPRYPGLQFGLPAWRSLRARWRADRPDLVHVATEGPLGWAAVATARRLGLPVSSDFRTRFDAYSRHYVGGEAVGRLVRCYLRAFHQRTDCTFVPTPALAAELRALGVARVRVSGRGIDASLFTPARRDPVLRAHWGASDEAPVALVVGRLAAEKNLFVAVEAWRAMQARHAGARLVLVGDGPLRAAVAQACPEAVLAGTRLGIDLASHYASADVFLFPSLSETFGNVTLEAMASGLALVAFDAAAASVHVRPGRDGLLVPPGDVRAFVAAAAALATDAPRRARLGQCARATAQGLDWDAVLSQFEQRLEDLAAGQDGVDDGRPVVPA